ncbi:MAG: hypothetical protein CVU56_23780 [Deltaproteobacteria bacterium HGW-Deltaproteobacteria-14]|jgi:outer membrane beta-barrel protein|nr:MAG: hypothetical protein CVU56_23780 [Deltaproteobacteria bacterium HGW-Deltaproteobacteria-14]
MISIRRATFAILALLAGTAAAVPAARAEDPRGYPSLTVQNREYFGHHELGLAVGVLPMDAFTKGVTLSGSYTLRFNEVIGWEIVQVSHAFPVDSGLKSDLRAFDLEPQTFEVLRTTAMTNLVFTPIYWKGSVLNDGLMRGEMMLLVGGGVGWFTRSTRGGFDVGVAFRFYLSRLISLRLDVRYLGFVQSAGGSLDLHSDLWIGLGLAFTL